MQKATKSELQMLREMVWHFGEITLCEFCHRPLLHIPPGMTFGHRRHPPIDTKLTIHHRDRNRDNNQASNRVPAHRSCHIQYHANLRRTSSEPDDESTDVTTDC